MYIGILFLIAIIYAFTRKKENNTSVNEKTNFPALPSFGAGKLCSKYENEIIAASNIMRVPAKILDAMIFVESGDGTNINHQSGEIGVMAVKPSTAKDVIKNFGSKFEFYNLNIPAQNIIIAAGYLKMCYNYWGNWQQAICAYNLGIKNPNVRNTNNPYLDRIIERMQISC